MLDVLFVLGGIVFFAIAILYVYGCDRLIRENQTVTEQVETMGERPARQGQAV